MNIIFYNVTSIVIGLFILIFSIFNSKKIKIYQTIIYALFGVFYITIGFLGQFVIPVDISYITLLIILILTLLLILFIFIVKRSEKK